MEKLKNIGMKGLPRIAVLIALFLLFNQIYKTFFWKNDLDKMAPTVLDIWQKQDMADVLYFAESSNFTTSPKDSLKLRISDFADQYCDDLRIVAIEHPAYDARQFLPLLKNVESGKTVIVTMNLRTFGPDNIYGGNTAQLLKESRFYEPNLPIMTRLLASLNFYDNRSGHERDIEKWKHWIYDTFENNDSIKFQFKNVKEWTAQEKFLSDTGSVQLQKRIIADQNIKVYGFKIDENNPILKAFDEMVDVAKSKDITLIFNILAENVEQTETMVGHNLVWLMRQNRDFLVDRYGMKNVLVIDNLELVGDIHFLDRETFPTEHYDQIGRQIIGKKIAEELTKIGNK
ncbi:MAG: hypothetical protein H6607_07270 [Flavobacteriales bacterium]|nr:hypothetical protein [Flavobacteriales bacterium]